MKRRDLLQGAAAAILLALPGCKKRQVTTTLQFVNATNAAVTVHATGGGRNFDATNLAVGGLGRSSFKSSDTTGTMVPLTGTIVTGGTTINIPAGINYTVGKINTYTVTGDALAVPPVLNVLTNVL